MSYETNVTGEITIDPPIPWGAIRDSAFVPHRARGDAEIQDRKERAKLMRDVCFKLERLEVDVEDGKLTRIRAVALVPTHSNYAGDSGKVIERHVQEVIDAFPDRTFSGRINGEGEENGDMWRVKVVAGRAIRFFPQVVWPEESE